MNGRPCFSFYDLGILEFRTALTAVRAYLARPETTIKIATISAWNEWTEGSYLEPDRRDGMARLQAIKKVFG